MKFERWLIIACLILSACAAVRNTKQTPEIKVDGFTSAAIQAAVDRARPGDTIYLPAGDYLCSRTVEVKTDGVTIRGAAKLMNVGVIEPGPENIAPAWDSKPSRCASPGNINQNFFRISADGVTMRDLFIEGNITHTSGRGIAIQTTRHNRLTIDGCELKRNMIGVGLYESRDNLVQHCYIHENYRNGMGYGVMAVGGNDMMVGGSTVRIANNEFTLQRHDIASNGPQTRYVAENNYFHDNDETQNQASCDAHPQGQMTLSIVVRDNFFENCIPGYLASGSAEWTGNTFERCTKRPYLVTMGIPSHNGRYIPGSCDHDSYFGENDNRTTATLLNVLAYKFPDVRWVVYSLFEDGDLWEVKNTKQRPYAEGTRPMIGHMFWTEPGGTEEIKEIKPNKFYDLHVMAVDPQGAGDIKEIGVQIREENTPYTPGNEGGAFDPKSNIYLKANPEKLYMRLTKNSSEWTDLSLSKPRHGRSIAWAWKQNGTHRIELTMRVNFPKSIIGTQWRLQGYALDNEGNRPIENWHEKQEGWRFSIAAKSSHAGFADAVVRQFGQSVSN